MGLFNKNKKVDYSEFARSITSIAVDNNKLCSQINLLNQQMIEIREISKNNSNALAGLVELLKNTSTKKELSKKNKISEDQTFTTKELYDLMLNILD